VNQAAVWRREAADCAYFQVPGEAPGDSSGAELWTP